MERLPISTAHCTVEQDGHVVIVTMNRPEARNALSTSMLVGMADAFAYISQTPEVRVGILTGAGGHFCSGADLKAMGTPPEDEREQRRAAEITNYHWKGLLREAVPTKPIIAAIEGYAVAGGTELLLGTDLRVVAEGATLGLYEAKRGLFPMGGSVVRLPRQIGYAPAMEILLTARSVTPQEALAMGLINRVVPDGQALSAARELADQIAACAPLSVQAILRAHRETFHLPEEEALKVSDEIGWPIFATEDAQEGPRAFREKRPPVFKGR
ncbi:MULTISPECIES: crotonase/enoyl-CoA hydratase family protein [Thermomonospora]|uniref:Enoyl-CoA hydratase/isomerase n=1 Tax=Thermomonospora curvata (strain ATCC 19995 / DSM 43183 / JCM 3096 / KCTC 9072 / NBRC 15933 / NCIMB 10081 / Henssen B9) TaxID=471852 RepID=D1AE88_THECD|nr:MULTISPECIES: crotonase/enoyl-CoA hydratase family protein [Thermomonospora]ACY99514.1 Enoyl-CoA hydratase/isomerase [Thermomonospora curvata DSM 43183]PKK12556.1 MAG: enoyl-CoA hydratase [Thermomonospora sp. CIF 1]